MLLKELSWQTVSEYLGRDDRIILPIGSVEQHGPIGVFGTDHLIPEAIAAAIADQMGIIAAPVLSYGMSQHHMSFPGTMSLEPSTLMLVVRDLLTSLSRHGFRRVMILNGHGGNIAPVQSAIAETCHRITDTKIKFFSWWEKEEIRSLIEEIFGDGEGHHGTPSEISIVMYLYPALVQDRDFPVQPPVNRKYATNYIRFRELFPDGSINSNARLASGEKGERVYKRCIEVYSKEMLDWD
jgi:creatinine amidohydrolase